MSDPIDPPVGDPIPARRSLRVCHVAYTFYENDNRVRRYAETLAERGHQVDVVALRRRGQSRTGRVGSIRVLRAQYRTVTETHQVTYLFKLLLFFARVLAIISVRHIRRPYDVIHVHNVPDFLVFAAILPKLLGAAVILDIHDIMPELYAGKFKCDSSSVIFKGLVFAERRAGLFADHVIVANALWHSKLVARSLTADRCTSLLNYPDLHLFKPLSAHPERHGRPFIILYPGTLNYHQGLDIAIRAFSFAADRMPSAELHIYGEGPTRSSLVALAAELGISRRVRFMNPLPLEEIAPIIAAADVGIVPKRADGFGNEAFSTKTLEFMACGVPVVVARTAVDTHYFDNSLVRFFLPGSEADLSRAMVDIYDARPVDPSWIDRMKSFAVANSWQNRAGEYHRLIDVAMTHRKAV